MGHKPERLEESESELTAFVLTLLGRLVQIMRTGTNTATSGKHLEELLQSVLQVPWLKTFAADLLAKLDTLSDKQWSRKFIGFCQRWAALISVWYIENGENDPLRNQTPVEKARFIAKALGWSKLRWFISDMRHLCRVTLEKVSQGGSNDLSPDVTSGLFTKNLASGLELMNLVFYLSGGKTLVNQVEEATQLIKEKMDSQMALVAAMEIAERQYKWTLPSTEEGFQNTWDSMEPKLIYQTWKHDLEIPGTHLSVTNGGYKEHLDEELAFLQESVFEELIRRIKSDPMKVFQDGIEGKLHNSLAVAAISDLRDLIKALRAQKRDVKKETFTSSLQNTGADRDIDSLEVQIQDKMAQAISSEDAPELFFEEMIEGLDDNEKKY